MITILKALLIIRGIAHIHLSSAQKINTTCLHVPDNGCFRAAFTTSSSACQGWLCWESQLTLTNKRFIIITLNQFRNSEAQNVTNMNKLIWHWTLEQEAIRASSTCQRKYVERYLERRDIPGLGFSLLCENGCMYREDMVLPSQTLFKQLLYSFLRESGSMHQDIHSTEESFRKANAQFVGCALVVIRSIVKDSYQNIFVFVCVFCTKDAAWQTYSNSTGNQCTPPGSLGIDKRYPNLCSDLQFRHIFLCEPANPCPFENRTEIWQTEFEGLVSRLIFVQTNTGPVLLVNETTTEISRLDDGTVTSVTTIRAYADKDGEFLKFLQVYPALPESIYFHLQHEAALYDDILHSAVGPNVNYVYLENPAACQVINPAAAIEGTADAFCCLYLMLGTLLTTILLGVLVAYTVDHYRKKTQ